MTKLLFIFLVYLAFIAWDSLEIHKTHEYMKKKRHLCPCYIFNLVSFLIIILDNVKSFFLFYTYLLTI